MKKAYDSVSLQSLRIALQRIDLPALLVKWIINLFRNREMQIITDYGLSPSFSASDGIDQGDALSPLLWRIFYDPLLVAIQSTAGLGYTTSLTWPHDVFNQDTWESFSANVAVLAYMDDTIFAGASQIQMQRTVDLTNSFYDLHDIDINGSK